MLKTLIFIRDSFLRLLSLLRSCLSVLSEKISSVSIRLKNTMHSVYLDYFFVFYTLDGSKIQAFVSRHKKIFSLCRYILLFIAALLIFQGFNALYTKLIVYPTLNFLTPNILPKFFQFAFENPDHFLVSSFFAVLRNWVSLRKPFDMSLVIEISFQLGLLGLLILVCVLGCYIHWSKIIEDKCSGWFLNFLLLLSFCLFFESGKLYGFLVSHYTASFSYFCFFLQVFFFILLLFSVYFYLLLLLLRLESLRCRSCIIVYFV